MALSLCALGLFAGMAAAQHLPLSSKATSYSRESLGRTGQAPAQTLAQTPAQAPQLGPLDRVAAQIRPKGEEDLEYFQIYIEPPDPERLFRRESEKEWRERIKQEARRRPTAQRIIFPEEIPLTKEPYVPRQFPPLTETVEPAYVMHGRLYFEQRNFERYGWDLGILTPALNLGTFYKDMVLLPYHWWTRPCQRYETSAGKCLPGDPTPLYLYPFEWSVTGFVGQAGVMTAGFFIFP
jgi:hypothetical protein